MKKSILIIISCLFSLVSKSQEPNLSITDSTFEEEKSLEDVIGKPFPAFRITNGHRQVSNESLLGKTIYVNFWFAACSPCMAEMPQINDLYTKFKSDTNFVFLSMTFDDAAKINLVRQKRKIEYEISRISRSESMRLNPSHTYPASIVTDKKGIVKYYDIGGMGLSWLTTLHFKRKIYPAIEEALNSR